MFVRDDDHMKCCHRMVEELTKVTEAPVKPWVTQTRAIGSVTAPIVSTVALLIALFAIEAFWTA